MRLIIDLQGAQGSNSKRGIGRYSRELALAMARSPRGHEVVIALNGAMTDTAEDLVARFAPVLPRGQIRTWFSPASAGDEAYVRRAAQILRAQFLASLKPDLVHVSSLFEGLGDLCVTHSPPGLERLPLAATCYDLIPLIRRKEYLDKGGVLERHTRWYYAGLHEMFLTDGLLAISDSSAREAAGYLGYDATRIFNIRAGIHPDFSPPVMDDAGRRALSERYGLTDPFILFVGAGDIRKNEAALVRAYTLLPAELRRRHQLVIVGGMADAPLRRIIEQAGDPPDRLVVIRFVKDGDLPQLYGRCALFVFPSLHEGFGLPAAEAMACGAPVIASNSSSLPEVVGLADALFDPAEPGEIAALMARVLGTSELRRRLVAHGLRQAARFTWEACAERAWDALEQIEDRVAATRQGDAALRALPSLGFVSPLPPQASGISDYSRSLLPALARHYDITLVSESGVTDDPWLDAVFPRLDAKAFLRAGAGFDRILYQLGCSDFHTFQYRQLLPKLPGVAVLHDAFLSNLWHWLAHHEGRPEEFLLHLYESHGYPALHEEARNGHDSAVRRYPCCLPILEQSLATIQHSEHARGMMALHFGEKIRRKIAVIPHLAHLRPRPDRGAARQRLGIGTDEFLVCTFGIVSPAKLPSRLLEAWKAIRGGGGRLAYVGATVGGLGDFPLRDGDNKEGALLTGRVDQETYDAWLAAADIAVQLRIDSRGESSGAMTDCLCFGVPLIVNAHGAACELPNNAVLKISDRFETAALRDAIERLRHDTALRTALARSGRAFAEQHLNPARIAEAYRDVIERAYLDAASASPLSCAGSLARLDTGTSAGEAALDAVSQAIAATFRASPYTERLLIDMSEFARHDARSGIQRVVREVGWRLLTWSDLHRRVESVRFHDGQLRHAHEAGTRAFGGRPLPIADMPIDIGENDTLLCMDPNPAMTDAEFTDLRQRRLAGLRLVLVVYDLLPLLRPDCFPEGVAQVWQWYTRMLAMADQAICISRAVADELATWLDMTPALRATPLAIDYFHLAGDFRTDGAVGEASAAVMAAMACTTRRPTFLMSGTLEPRKGYRQALAAFERLWAGNEDVGLVIVGKQGWMMDDLARHIRTHPYLGGKLHWLESLHDVELRRFYGMSSCLLMASEGEGFGLPIVEAARAGLPILARDLPVFREIAGAHASYFSGLTEDALTQALRAWLRAWAQDAAPSSNGIQTLDWDGSVRQLLTRLGEHEPYRIWSPPGQRLAPDAETAISPEISRRVGT